MRAPYWLLLFAGFYAILAIFCSFWPPQAQSLRSADFYTPFSITIATAFIVNELEKINKKL